MPLNAIIIRAEGILAHLEPLRMRAFQQVFQEAGLTWTADREIFVATRRFGSSRKRMVHLVHRQLRGRPETRDTGQLIAAMHRRAGKLFSEYLRTTRIAPRPCVRDLVIAAAEESVTVGILTGLSADDTDELLRQTLGDTRRHIATVWSAPETLTSDGNEDFSGYARVADDVRFPHATTLVLEGMAHGADQAMVAGYRTLTVRDPSCRQTPSREVSDAMVDDLSVLLGRDRRCRLDPMSRDERSRLVAALQRFMAGTSNSARLVEGNLTMRVSDVLKSKGSAVRTIEPDATIRAFAHALKHAGVGAMVVFQAETGKLIGIISERDLARGLADFGAELPLMKVRDLMTKDVITCRPEDSISAVARLMTQRRIRHVPVVRDGALVGMISTGDALVRRLDEVQLEANIMRDYAIARG